MLLLPWLVDSRLTKDKISSELEKTIAGRSVFGRILFVWFPRPHVVIEDFQVSFSDETAAAIQSAKIYPSVFHLLTGRVVVREMFLEQPRIRTRMPASSTQPLDFEQLEKEIRSALVRFTTKRSPRRSKFLTDRLRSARTADLLSGCKISPLKLRVRLRS